MKMHITPIPGGWWFASVDWERQTVREKALKAIVSFHIGKSKIEAYDNAMKNCNYCKSHQVQDVR